MIRYDVITVTAIALGAAAAAAATVAAYRLKRLRLLQLKLAELEAALEHAQQQRAAERTGRIRAQRELRKSLIHKDLGNGSTVAYPMTPIGTVRSCFSTRNGTPRQPLLAPLAKAHLVLTPGGVPHEALDGLALYSHCWILYVFHENTDLPRLWSKPGHRDFRAKVRVPRLDGAKSGVFSTRSPHRPCPIGLSVAKIDGVRGGTLMLSGVDLVDGTPVLDLKPYLNYCDSVPEAVAPPWVKAGGADDVLAIAGVKFTDKFRADITSCWESMGKQSLYSSPEEFQLLLEQVLSRDIRSLSQRQRPHNAIVNDLVDSSKTDLASEVPSVTVDLASTDVKPIDGNMSHLRVSEAASEPASNIPPGLSQDRGGTNEMLDFAAMIEASSIEGTRLSCKGLKASVSNGDVLLMQTDFSSSSKAEEVIYHLILEGIKVAYTVSWGEVLVTGAALVPRL